MSISPVGFAQFSPFPDVSKSELIEDVQQIILSYLTPKELCQLTDASVLNDISWRKLCEESCELPADAPIAEVHGMYYKELYKKIFETAIGIDFYQEYFGGVPHESIPKVPLNITQKIMSLSNEELKDWQLLYVPMHLDIEVDTSLLCLDENGLLMELDKADSFNAKSRGETRVIKVPLTLNQIGELTEKFLKKGIPTQFNENSWENIFTQHGNCTAPSSHWVLQKKSLIGFGKSYAKQEKLAKTMGLEVVPLIDRVLFNLLIRISLGEFPEGGNVARTSTQAVDYLMITSQAAVWWIQSDSSYPSFPQYLSISTSVDLAIVGAAVCVPIV